MQQAKDPTDIDCSTSFDIQDLKEPGFDDNALVILRNRYLIKDEDNNIIETPKEMIWRVAVFVASAEVLYLDDVYDKEGTLSSYIKQDMFNPDLCTVYDDDMYDLSNNEDLKSIMVDYNLTEGMILALFRAWYNYQRMGRMKVEFDKLMEIYARRFITDIFPVAMDYYELMANLEFMPNTPTLMNSGFEKSLLSGCFVLPVEDELISILDTCRDAALVHKAGGGTGFSFSRLRPRRDVVDGRPDGASGPVSFMKVFNTTTGEIKQGFSRRGANMGVLNVHHPDIMEFINCKIPPVGAVYVSPDDVPFSNFNISVAVTDNFMKAVKSGSKYPLINPRTNETVDMVDAKLIWDKIIHNAWENGDPGMIFIDEMNRHNPTPELGEYESTNPCGEQVLLPNESCNLGAINLNKMITEQNTINYPHLKDIIGLCVKFLNGVLDMNYLPLRDIEELTRNNRKIGLGYMGFADVLYSLEIPYDHQDAVELARSLANTLTDEALCKSIELADERGPFPNVEHSIYAKKIWKPFNAALTTIAPTGTTGIIANSVSGGIEPVMFLKYHRRTFEGESLETIHPIFLEKLKKLGLDDKRIMNHVHEHGTISDIQPQDIFDDGDDVQRFSELQEIFKVAHDIDYTAHVRMQAAFQEYIDSSISKTINFSSSATEKDVENAFLMSHELLCKGITIYRDGSKGWQVINKSTKESDHLMDIKPMKLPDSLPSRRFRVETGCGSIYVMISYDEKTKRPLEVFIEMGKSGGCAMSWAHGLGRLVSTQLRYGLPVEEIIKQLENIQCHTPLPRTVSKKRKISSCVDAIAVVLKEFLLITKGNNDNVKNKDRETRKDCPRCGSGHLVHTEGCVKCQNCDWSKCD